MVFQFQRRRDLLALLAYFLLTLVLTYPLILNFTTHVAGDGSDDPALAWNLWWVPYSLLNLGSSPIYTNYMFFPIGLNLGFYTLTYLNAFLAIPFQFAFGIIPAANINLILSFALSGFGAYLLVTYLLNRTRMNAEERGNETNPRILRLSASNFFFAAFAAGLVYAFSANKFLYASLGQFNIASSQWIPFYILFLLKIFDSPKPPLRYGFLLGFFLLAQALSEFIFASFLILFTFAYILYRLIKTRFQIKNQKSKIKNLLLAFLVFTIPMLPILAAMISDTLTEGDFIQQGLGFSNIFSADLVGFFVPSQLHPLFGSLVSRFSFPYINFMYLGFTALALAILALWKVKPARIWGFWFLLFALISLGPTLRINGAEFDLPMPFDALLEIPLIKGNRYPSRWSVMLTLSLAVLVGYGLAWFLNTVGRRQKTERGLIRFVLPAALCLLLVFEPLSTPLPLSNLQVPSIYSEIARGAGNFSVMEIPLAWRNGFRVTGSYRADSQAPIDRIFMYAQFYQTTQQHPILNGNTSRNPELKFQYFAEAPVLNSLVALQMGHEIDAATRARDKELAPRVLQFFGTRYIMWHSPFEETNRDVANKTRAYIEETFPATKISESYENGRGVVAYRANELPANESLILKPNDPLARLYFGEGWGALGGDEFWAQRKEAKLFLPLETPRDMKLALSRFESFGGPHWGISANGVEISQQTPPEAETQIAMIPKTLLRSGMNEITFSFDKTLPIAESPNHQNSLVVRSTGEEQGAFGHIFVNGIDESPNARGYNIVVINPETFQVEARENFDTFASEQESERMAEFIAQIPNGRIVAVAASDEASFHLTENAVNALKSLGAKQDLRGKFRWSHALIATKGEPQTAREAASEINVSQLVVGAAITERTAAASIGEIRIEPAP
ncbi:MAG: hypothetical protein EYC68_12975 [Chloroflexota bacterium]|nr:MAG: hypothetical protein EYC68_12975 [Chloroflexota bacterium]